MAYILRFLFLFPFFLSLEKFLDRTKDFEYLFIYSFVFIYLFRNSSRLVILKVNNLALVRNLKSSHDHSRPHQGSSLSSAIFRQELPLFMAVPYLETEIDISTFLNRGRLPDLYLKINLFEKYFANILTEKPFLFYAHRVVMIRVITFALKKPARVEWGEKIDFTGG